jgi:transglutaminase-like putative cysteine protease
MQQKPERQGPERAREALLFLLRNLLLYSLLAASFLQLRDVLDLAFQSATFLLAVLASLWMAKARLRLVPSVLLAVALPFALRAVFFLVFRLQRLAASAPATDFLFFFFDKDFFSALVPWGIAWLFNSLALRYRPFLVVETGLNAGLLVMVLWSQAGYRLTLFSHPSILANLLAVFILAELVVLLLARRERPGLRSVMGFGWVLVPLLLVFLLFLLGRYGEGAVKAGGGLMKPTLFRFDFSPYVRLESEIRTTDELVLLFRTEGEAERYLLRRFVLSGYDPRRGFFMEPRGGIDERAAVVPDRPESLPDPGYRGRTPIDQAYFFLAIDPTSLIAINYPTRVVPLKNWKASSFLRVYRVQSSAVRSAAAPTSTGAATEPAPLAPAALAFYTRYGGDPEIRALALQITEKESGYAAKVRAIERFLQMGYLYSLRPGIAADGDQLHHFLFDSKKGYCSYFAFAMALLCRSIGIPARVAVGFFVDPAAEVLNFYEVRAFQAHAWVEVWFGDLGWIEFDPTSQTLAPGEQFSFFLGPDKEKLSKLLSEILQNQPGLEEEQAPREGAASTAAGIVSGIGKAVLLLARLWYLTLPTLYLLFLVSAKLLPSLPGLLSANGRRGMKAGYRLRLVELAGIGLGRRPGESHLEHAQRIERERGIRLEALTGVYLKAVFGEAFGAADLREARAARLVYLASLRGHVSWPVRALGLLSPFGSTGRRP